MSNQITLTEHGLLLILLLIALLIVLALIQTKVRRLTPVECERLQGFPDNFTRIPWRGKAADNCPDGPRYKVLGNSMAVPVMAWIGKRIDMVEKTETEEQQSLVAADELQGSIPTVASKNTPMPTKRTKANKSHKKQDQGLT